MTHMPHPPCSLDLVPSDFFLFPWMKKSPQRKSFADVEEVKQKTEAVKGIKIEKFKNCFEQWKNRLESCITSNGEYSEGD